MNNENVTEYMDWLSQNIPWIAVVVGVIIKFAQDHLRINTLENAMEDTKEKMREIEKIEKARLQQLASIEAKVDYIVEAVRDNKDDIKDIYKRK